MHSRAGRGWTPATAQSLGDHGMDQIPERMRKAPSGTIYGQLRYSLAPSRPVGGGADAPPPLSYRTYLEGCRFISPSGALAFMAASACFNGPSLIASFGMSGDLRTLIL